MLTTMVLLLPSFFYLSIYALLRCSKKCYQREKRRLHSTISSSAKLGLPYYFPAKRHLFKVKSISTLEKGVKHVQS